MSRQHVPAARGAGHVVTVVFRIAPAHRETFMQEMVRNAAASLANEDGCLQFDVCTSPTEPLEVFLYEIYTDAEAFQHHLDSDHFKAFSRVTSDWITDKVIRQYGRVPPATAA